MLASKSKYASHSCSERRSKPLAAAPSPGNRSHIVVAGLGESGEERRLRLRTRRERQSTAGCGQRRGRGVAFIAAGRHVYAWREGGRRRAAREESLEG